jgi:hypothetical protein
MFGYSNSLRAGQSGDEIPMGARFSALSNSALVPTQPPVHLDAGSFSGIKRPCRGVDHPSAPSAEVKKRVELYLYSSYEPS